MPTLLSSALVREFFALCNWTCYCWQFHRAVYHDGGREAELAGTAAGNALGRLSLATMEYCHLQLTKLHDPAQSGPSRKNLGLDYVIVNGGWSPAVVASLEDLRRKLNTLGKDVLSAPRNKIICHNDVDTILAKKSLGGFVDGLDAEYFVTLQEFVNIVSKEAFGHSHPFDQLGKSEGAALVASIGCGDPLARGDRPIAR